MKKTIKIFIVSVILLFSVFVPIAFADSLGQSDTFNVDSGYDYNQRTQVVATLQYIGERGYFYIEDTWWNSLGSYERSKVQSAISNLSKEFDTIIYSKLTEFFGDVWNPGIDGDERIIILVTKLINGAAGYFNSCNEYKLSECSNSNEREMLHINADFILDSKLKSYFAHEFQHLINWNQKDRLNGVSDDVWINEMRSEYAPTLLGYNDIYYGSILETRVASFLANPSNPLGEWRGESNDYGVIALFGEYLANQFGSNLFSLMSQNSLISINSVNRAIKDAGYSEEFNDIFINWSMTNYFNNLAIGSGGKFGYTNPSLKKISISPTINNFSSYGLVSFSETIKDWSPRWYLLQNNLSSNDNSIVLKIEFKSSNTNANFKVPYMINYKNGNKELGFINIENQTGVAYIFNFAVGINSVLVAPANHSKTANFTNNDPSTIFVLQASTVIISQPVILNISPNIGSVSGGNNTVIRGGNFQPGIEVYFGGIKSLNVAFLDENSLNVIVPLSNEAGLVNVWVKNPDGKSSVFAGGYKYGSGIVTDGSLIRAMGDYKVYIVNKGYKRHILDSKIFSFYGHLDWASVIEVNPEERDAYQTSDLVRADGDSKVYEINGDKTKHWLNMTAEQFVASGRSWGGVFIINKLERDFYKTGASVLYR